MPSDNIQQFKPSHCAICETSDFTWADCVHGAYAQGISDVIKEAEKMRDAYRTAGESSGLPNDMTASRDIHTANALDVLINRLKSLGPFL